MDRNDIGRLLYETKHESIESFYIVLSNVMKSSGRRMNFALFTSKAEIATVFKHRPEGVQVQVEPLGITHRIKAVHEGIRSLKEEASAVCVKLSAPFLYLLVSDAKPASFKKLILKLIYFNYPMVSRVFMRNSEMLQIMKNLKFKGGLETIVHKVLFYSRLQDDVQDKDLKWTKRPFEEVYSSVMEQNGWIRKIDFRSFGEEMRIYDHVKVQKLYGSMSSDCHFVLKGDFEKFHKYILHPLIDTIKQRVSYLEERSKTADKRLAEPLVIKFAEPQFNYEGWNEHFIEEMAKLENVSITEYRTSPYIHISLIDYKDGSSYSVWIVAENLINIIPQGRASIASMTRLLKHIFEKVQEGEVVKYVPVEPVAE